MKQHKRICIYTKDIVRITGKSDRYARKLISKMRIALCKEENQFVTIHDFCVFTGLSIEQVEVYIID